MKLVLLVGLSLCAVLAQSQKLSADEINARLQSPITFKTNPVRLPVALDELGRQIGVRIRCQTELRNAVVVVGVRNKPASEVLRHLADGIAATYGVSNGEIAFGFPAATEESRRALIKAAIEKFDLNLKNQAITRKSNEPLDLQAARAAVSGALQALRENQGTPGWGASVLATYRSPSTRAGINLLGAIGGDFLYRVDRPNIITLESLDPERREKARRALNQYYSEQQAWSQVFGPLIKEAETREIPAYLDDLLFISAAPRARADNLQVKIQDVGPNQVMTVEVMAGGKPVSSHWEFLYEPERIVHFLGDPFRISEVGATKVEPSDTTIAFNRYLSMLKKSELVQYDWSQHRLLADPLHHDPHSLSLIQPLADVAQELGLNVVYYLSDGHFENINSAARHHLIGSDNLPLKLALNRTAGIATKKDDWLLSYVAYPDEYLRYQIDRTLLDQMLKLALNKGVLTMSQQVSFSKAGRYRYDTMRSLARIVRPGFDDLNPPDLDAARLMAMLGTGAMNRARTQGIAFRNLPEPIRKEVAGLCDTENRLFRSPTTTVSNGRLPRPAIESAVIRCTDVTEEGLLIARKSPNETGLIGEYFQYSFFHRSEMRRNGSVGSALQSIRGDDCWYAKRREITFIVEFGPGNGQTFTSVEFYTDITAPPLSIQARDEIIKRLVSEG